MEPIAGAPSTTSVGRLIPALSNVAVSDTPGTEGEELQFEGPLQSSLDVPIQVPLTACAGAAERKNPIAVRPSTALPAHSLTVLSRRDVR